jgi:hypothetical protein
MRKMSRPTNRPDDTWHWDHDKVEKIQEDAGECLVSELNSSADV